MRNQSLDALRGYAILSMVLSGSIAFGGILPGWMYHAQVPPPLHNFDPSIPGITWVDLVFPFFLFSMGAAIPLSLKNKTSCSIHTGSVWMLAARRLVLLTFFALFTQHLKPWILQSEPELADYIISLAAFVFLSIFFFDFKSRFKDPVAPYFQPLLLVAGCVWMISMPYDAGTSFSAGRVDIIILVLANMAFAGTLLWWYTRHYPVVRIAVLAFIMSVFLASKIPGSWNEALYNFSPVPWIYRFYYLKYLFILFPGTLAGEWMLKYASGNENNAPDPSLSVSTISLLLIVINTWFLYERWLLPNLLITITGAFLLLIYQKDKTGLLKRFSQAGAILLLLGLSFEATEGGIHKDPSNYSYYFVCSGLAFYALIFLQGMGKMTMGKNVVSFLARTGQNPMVAYVCGSLLLWPVLHLSGLHRLLEILNANPWTGFIRGIIFTGLVAGVTLWFVKKKWFWKT